MIEELDYKQENTYKWTEIRIFIRKYEDDEIYNENKE